MVDKNCIFCKITRGEITKEFEYEDKNIVAFSDITPARPVHILFVPRIHIEDFNDITDQNILDSVRKGVQKVIADKKLMGKGYRVLVNGGGAQIINHLHFHLLSPMGHAVKL